MATEQQRDRDFSIAQRRYDAMEPDYGDAYTGEYTVDKFYDMDDNLYEDIEVEIDDGTLHNVVSVCGNRDRVLCEKVLALMEERGWEYDG